MYQKAKNSWIKHIDFVILDILCLQVSFFLAYLVRHRNLNLYSNSVYGNLAIVLILIDVCMMFFLNTCKNVLKRGLLIELAATMRQVSLVILFAVFYLFFVKDAGDFSRITLFLTAIFYAIISYGTRILWKRHVLRSLRLGRKNSIVILTDWANLPQVREDIQHHSYELFQIRGIAVIDVNEKKTLPEKLGDIPFVAEGESVMDYLCHAWVDEVFIDLQPNDPRVDRWIDQLTEMGTCQPDGAGGEQTVCGKTGTIHGADHKHPHREYLGTVSQTADGYSRRHRRLHPHWNSVSDPCTDDLS